MRKSVAAGFAVVAGILVCSTPLHARITKIVVDEKISPAFCKGASCASYGDAGQYEQIAGRAFGELDPGDPLNKIIQDIGLGKDPDGKVRYVATFVVTKPVDMAKASGLMWHDVPNRGRPLTISNMERSFGDVGLASAWQGDNASMRAGLGTAVRPTMNAEGNHWLQVPVAKNPDGSPVTGPVMGRIVNRSGPDAQPLIIQTNPLPYMPASLDTSKATLVTRDHESMEGVVTGETSIAGADWKFCGGGTFDAPVPLTKLPVQICVKGGFNPAKLYQVVYTAKDPYVLGIGFAAWRDIASFFKYVDQDDVGTANPLAGSISRSITRGRSQSGNYLRGWLHLGFNQDEAKRRVHDGMWPIIAGRRIALNLRWAQPDSALALYQAGSEGPQWWVPYPDETRGLLTRSILDRCNATKTCPKIIEHFGSAEIWGLKLSPEWVGTNPKEDIPLPDNVRRYYIGSTMHGGGVGGFDTSLPAVALAAKPVECEGNNAGVGALPTNPMPHTETVNALTVHFRDWVMHNTPPPASRYPTLRERQLVERQSRPRWVSRRFRDCAPSCPSRALSIRFWITTGALASIRTTDRVCRAMLCRPSSRSSNRWCRKSTPTAMKSAACRSCCARRRSAPTSDGTSSPTAHGRSTRASFAGTPAALSLSQKPKPSAWPTATRACRSKSVIPTTRVTSWQSEKPRPTPLRRSSCCRRMPMR